MRRHRETGCARHHEPVRGDEAEEGDENARKASEARTGTEQHSEAGSHRDRQQNPQDASRIHPAGEPPVDLRRGDDPGGVGAEKDPEPLGRHVEDLDEHEGRTRDVGEQPREHESAREHVTHVCAIAQQPAIGGEDDRK